MLSSSSLDKEPDLRSSSRLLWQVRSLQQELLSGPYFVSSLYYVAELPLCYGFVRYLRLSTKFEISSQNLFFEALRSICYSPPVKKSHFSILYGRVDIYVNV